MAHYVRIWSTIYDGTLREDPDAMNTFLHLLILANEHGVVDMTPQAIAGRTGQPLDAICRGLAVLAAPDPASRTGAEKGRRIMPVDPSRSWGWTVVNFAEYRLRGSTLEQRRAQDAERQRRHRMARGFEESTAAAARVEVAGAAAGLGIERDQVLSDMRDSHVTVTLPVQNVTTGSRNKVVGTTETKDKGTGEEQRRVTGNGAPWTSDLGAVVSFPLKQPGLLCCITTVEVAELKRLHPGVDVDRELKVLAAWCQSNPKKRKVKPWAFVSGWMRRELKRRAPGGGDRTRADLDWARREAGDGAR